MYTIKFTGKNNPLTIKVADIRSVLYLFKLWIDETDRDFKTELMQVALAAGRSFTTNNDKGEVFEVSEEKTNIREIIKQFNESDRVVNITQQLNNMAEKQWNEISKKYASLIEAQKIADNIKKMLDVEEALSPQIKNMLEGKYGEYRMDVIAGVANSIKKEGQMNLGHLELLLKAVIPIYPALGEMMGMKHELHIRNTIARGNVKYRLFERAIVFLASEVDQHFHLLKRVSQMYGVKLDWLTQISERLKDSNVLLVSDAALFEQYMPMHDAIRCVLNKTDILEDLRNGKIKYGRFILALRWLTNGKKKHKSVLEEQQFSGIQVKKLRDKFGIEIRVLNHITKSAKNNTIAIFSDIEYLEQLNIPINGPLKYVLGIEKNTEFLNAISNFKITFKHLEKALMIIADQLSEEKEEKKLTIKMVQKLADSVCMPYSLLYTTIARMRSDWHIDHGHLTTLDMHGFRIKPVLKEQLEIKTVAEFVEEVNNGRLTFDLVEKALISLASKL